MAEREVIEGTGLPERLAILNEASRTEENQDPILGTTDVLVTQWRRERPELDLDGFELALRVRRLAMLLDEQLSSISKPLNISLSDLLLLMAFRRQGPSGTLRPTDIMKMHSITSGTVTYKIDKLISGDFVQRLPDPTDLRGYLIRLTPHGCKVVDESITIFANQSNATLHDMFAIDGAKSLFVEFLRYLEMQFEGSPPLPSAAPVSVDVSAKKKTSRKKPKMPTARAAIRSEVGKSSLG